VGKEYAGAEMFQQDADSAAHLIRIHVTALSCHMICHAMRLKGLTQLPQHVTTTTSYSHKEYRCDIRWTEATSREGFFNGPHHNGDNYKFIWCSRCSKIGCYYENENCTTRIKLKEAMMASPKWQEVKASKEKRQSEYLKRMERKEEKEKKQKLGAAAALAFSRK